MSPLWYQPYVITLTDGLYLSSKWDLCIELARLFYDSLNLQLFEFSEIYYQTVSESLTFTLLAITLHQTSFRSDIPAGNITGEDILNVLPFNNTIDRVVVNGSGLRTVLENFAANLCPNQSCHPGTFLQVRKIRFDNGPHKVRQSYLDFVTLDFLKNFSILSKISESANKT